MWFWVALPFACFAVKVEEGRIVEGAPIALAHWRNKSSEQAFNHWRRQGGRILPLY